MKAEYNGVSFTDEDIVNIDDCIYAGEYNPHNVRPWRIFYGSHTLAVVFADCEQDALDIAADAGKLVGFALTNEQAYERDGREPAYLGDASDAYDIDELSIEPLAIPKRSFVAEFMAGILSVGEDTYATIHQFEE